MTRGSKGVEMDDGSEDQLWNGIELAQRRIRERVFRMGMAGRLHVEKGKDVLRDVELINKYVMPCDHTSGLSANQTSRS
jgi:predicted choloylglycine hydrolase